MIPRGYGSRMSTPESSNEPVEPPSEVGAPTDTAPPLGEPADESAPDGAARPSVATRSFGWRSETLATAMVTAVVSVWLIFSPEALGYGPGDATWNPVVSGVFVLVLSVGRIFTSWRSRVLGLILFVAGAWLAVSSFLFDAPVGGQLNQGSFGGVIALLSLIGLAGSQRGTELNPN